MDRPTRVIRTENNFEKLQHIFEINSQNFLTESLKWTNLGSDTE